MNPFLEQAVARIREREAGERTLPRPRPTAQDLVDRLGIPMAMAERMLADFERQHGRPPRV